MSTTRRREQLNVELRGQGHELVHRWVLETYAELEALKQPGVEHEGQRYRYVGIADYCAVFVLEPTICGKPSNEGSLAERHRRRDRGEAKIVCGRHPFHVGQCGRWASIGPFRAREDSR